MVKIIFLKKIYSGKVHMPNIVKMDTNVFEIVEGEGFNAFPSFRFLKYLGLYRI